MLADVVREYGSAIRGDWGSIDGRSVRGDMDAIADWLEGKRTWISNEVARSDLGICKTGGGHWCGSWYGYCDEDCGCDCDD